MITIIASTRLVYADSECLGSLNQSEINILLCLKNAEGNAVSRDELLSFGWPNRIVVPNSVNMAIKNIRDVFSKYYESPVIITTPKEGYTLLPNKITIETNPLVIEDKKKIPQDVSNRKTYCIDKRSFIYRLVVCFVIIILWGGALAMHYLEGGPECYKNKNKNKNKNNSVCYFDDDTHYQLRSEAPKNNGVYFYGKDSVTGRGRYEESNAN